MLGRNPRGIDGNPTGRVRLAHSFDDPAGGCGCGCGRRRGGAAPPPGGPAPNFALTTQQNDRLWLTQLRGRAVVLAFGCTACGACPGVLPKLAEVARGLGDAPGRSVFFALVTVDPARDSPAALREFGRANGFRAPAWILLTEDRAGQMDVVTRRFGIEIRRAGGRVEAGCAMTLIDSGRRDPGALRAGDARRARGGPAGAFWGFPPPGDPGGEAGQTLRVARGSARSTGRGEPRQPSPAASRLSHHAREPDEDHQEIAGGSTDASPRGAGGSPCGDEADEQAARDSAPAVAAAVAAAGCPLPSMPGVAQSVATATPVAIEEQPERLRAGA